MTQAEFMTQFANRLMDIPLEERQAALEYYNGYFQDAADAGRTQEEIIASLESPGQLAARIKAETAFSGPRKNPRDPKNPGRVIGAIFGILSLPITVPAAIVVAAIGVSLCAVLFALFVAAIAVVFALAVSAVVIGFNAGVLLFSGVGGAMVPILIGLVMIALGAALLCCALFWWILKGIVRAAAWIGRKIYRIFAGRKKTGVM